MSQDHSQTFLDIKHRFIFVTSSTTVRMSAPNADCEERFFVCWIDYPLPAVLLKEAMSTRSTISSVLVVMWSESPKSMMKDPAPSLEDVEKAACRLERKHHMHCREIVVLIKSSLHSPPLLPLNTCFWYVWAWGEDIKSNIVFTCCPSLLQSLQCFEPWSSGFYPKILSVHCLRRAHTWTDMIKEITATHFLLWLTQCSVLCICATKCQACFAYSDLSTFHKLHEILNTDFVFRKCRFIFSLG